MAERYTPYHLYPELPLNQASQARVESPTLGAYDCPNSQNAFLAQFDHVQQRAQYDHATTSCCDEPVYNFSAKPQYQFDPQAPKPKDCSQVGSRAKATCTGIARSSTPDHWCANSAGTIGNIRVHCDQNCVMLRDIELRRFVQGSYGMFIYEGRPSDTDVLLTYQTEAWVMNNIFANCTGESTFVEPFCGILDLTFRISAWMDSRDGCACDCCGENGGVPPVLALYASTQSSTYANTKALAGDVIANEACSDGSLSGNFNPNSGSDQAVPWTVDPEWVNDGTGAQRYFIGTPGTIGGSTRSACCGGVITWSGTDGCGGSDEKEITLAAAISGTPVISGTLSGNIIRPSTEYTISATQICSYSSTADLEFIDKVSVTTTDGSLVTTDGNLARTVTAEMSDEYVEGLCCGDGGNGAGFTVRTKNGCGSTVTHDKVNVRRAYGSGSTVAGQLLWCKLVTGGYQPHKRNFYCNGDIDTTQTPAIAVWLPTVGQCNAYIDAYDRVDMSALCSTGPSPCSTCCRYCNNGLTGADFRAALFCVNGLDQCCNWPVGENATAPFDNPTNCGWVARGSTCCPWVD